MARLIFCAVFRNSRIFSSRRGRRARSISHHRAVASPQILRRSLCRVPKGGFSTECDCLPTLVISWITVRSKKKEEKEKKEKRIIVLQRVSDRKIGRVMDNSIVYITQSRGFYKSSIVRPNLVRSTPCKSVLFVVSYSPSPTPTKPPDHSDLFKKCFLN